MTIQGVKGPASDPALIVPVDKSGEAKKRPGNSKDGLSSPSELRNRGRVSGRARTELSVAMEKETHRIVIKVIDVESREVIREIPSRWHQKAVKASQVPTGVFLDENL